MKTRKIFSLKKKDARLTGRHNPDTGVPEARLDMLASGDLPPEALRHDATARTGGRECEDPLKERLRVLVGELQADQGSAVSLPILGSPRCSFLGLPFN